MKTKFFVVVITLLVIVGNGVNADGCQTATMDMITEDNGMPNEHWATDHIHRTATVCASAGNFTITFSDVGTFTTLDAASPGGGGHVPPGIWGRLEGGGSISGHGSLVDPFPSYVFHDFTTDPQNYFEVFVDIDDYDYDSWGWRYTTCNERWVDTAATEALYHAVGPNDTMGDITEVSSVCQQGGAQLPPPWPGDDRVSPDAASRIAVYCEEDPNRILVYGLGEDVFLLAVFDDLEAVEEAGSAGLFQTAETGVGQVSLSGSEGSWYFSYVGPAVVNGEEIFTSGDNNRLWSKAFQCLD
jgi:hypothetical protein